MELHSYSIETNVNTYFPIDISSMGKIHENLYLNNIHFFLLQHTIHNKIHLKLPTCTFQHPTEPPTSTRRTYTPNPYDMHTRLERCTAYLYMQMRLSTNGERAGRGLHLSRDAASHYAVLVHVHLSVCVCMFNV